MKSKKFIGLLSIATCVLLGGCSIEEIFGGKKNQPVPGLSVGEFALNVEPGIVLDFDEYVTLENLSSYEVSVDDVTLAEVDGHKVTVLGEGQIVITVKAGDLQESFTLDSMYSIRRDFAAAVATKGEKYSMYEISYNETTEKLEQSGFITRTNDYYYDSEFFYVSQTMSKPGGYYAAEDRVYSYGFDGDEVVFQINGDEPEESIAEAFPEWNITLADTKYEAATEEYDELLYLDTDVEGKIVDLLGYDGSKYKVEDLYGYKFAGASILKEEVKLLDGTTKEMLILEPLVDVSGTNYYLAVWGLAPDFIPVEALETAVAQKVKPTSKWDALELLGEEFDKIIDVKNFTVDATWGCFNTYGQPAANPYSSYGPNYAVYYLSAAGTAKALVTENAVYKTSSEDGTFKEGLVKKDNEVYSFVEDNEGALNATLEEGLVSIFSSDASAFDNFSFMGTAEIVSELTVWDDVFVNSVAQTSKKLEASFTAYSAANLLTAFSLAFPTVEFDEEDDMPLNLYAALSQVAGVFTDTSITVTFKYTNDVITSASVVAELALSSSVSFLAKFEVSEIGTTDASALVADVVYPVVE